MSKRGMWKYTRKIKMRIKNNILFCDKDYAQYVILFDVRMNLLKFTENSYKMLRFYKKYAKLSLYRCTFWRVVDGGRL